jgi:CRP-like cAMP-binding protein
VIDRRAFTAILRDVPALSAKLMRALARRLRERDAQASFV